MSRDRKVLWGEHIHKHYSVLWWFYFGYCSSFPVPPKLNFIVGVYYRDKVHEGLGATWGSGLPSRMWGSWEVPLRLGGPAVAHWL